MKTYIYNHWEDVIERREAVEDELGELFAELEGMELAAGMTDTIRDHTIDTFLDYGFTAEDIANLTITVEIVNIRDDGDEVEMIHKIKVSF